MLSLQGRSRAESPRDIRQHPASERRSGCQRCHQVPAGREVVHFQRFGEGLRLAKDRMNEKNVYLVNPSFDK